MIRSRGALVGGALLALSLLFSSGALAAGKKDAQAERALHQALDEDYLQTKFGDAEQKLRGAITACGRDGCSAPLLAKLHAALGSVLAGGKKELEDARDEFVEALSLDPKLEPNPDISSAEVTFAFEQAQKKLKITPASKPADGKQPASGTSGTSGGTAAPAGSGGASSGGSATDKPPEPPATPGATRRNWISLAFMPDFSVVSGTDVCTKDVRGPQHFVCLRQTNGSRYVGTPTVGNGDNINAGFAVSTFRALLGYERLLGDNFTLGARLGFAFNGAKGPKVSFIPFHAEGRFAWWPRSKGFASAGVRPYFLLAAGFAQVDTRLNVQVLEDGEACQAPDPSNAQSKCTKPSPDGVTEDRAQVLTVYKQAGTAFASLGFGVQFAPIPNFGINLGVRGGATFPVVTALFSPDLALSLGF